MQSTAISVWAEKCTPLQIKVKQEHKSFYFYSAISPNSGKPFSLFLPEVSTEMMNLYLEEFSKEHLDNNILILMDQAGWHKSNDLRIPENINLKFLPPYSPELNPVEKLWQWLRKEATHNKLFNTLGELMDNLSDEYRKLTNVDFLKLCHCNYL